MFELLKESIAAFSSVAGKESRYLFLQKFFCEMADPSRRREDPNQ